MIGMKVTTQDTTDRVKDAAERASAGNVRSTAFLVMTDAKKSIEKAPPSQEVATRAETRRNKRGQFLKGSGKRRRKKRRRIPSSAGSPPYTLRGKLPRAIQYAASGSTAIIGPAYSVVGTGGEPHEHGGEYRGADYDERPFMRPSLEQNLSRYAGSYEGTIQ